MTIIEIYNKWRSSLKDPNDSIFYYHPSLDRIILGCAMYQIASRPLVNKLGKAESLTIINIYINTIVTAWIDEDDETFDSIFDTLMTLMDKFPICSQAMAKQHPGKKEKYQTTAKHFRILGSNCWRHKRRTSRRFT